MGGCAVFHPRMLELELELELTLELSRRGMGFKCKCKQGEGAFGNRFRTPTLSGGGE